MKKIKAAPKKRAARRTRKITGTEILHIERRAREELLALHDRLQDLICQLAVDARWLEEIIHAD
jgi:hypothetical protein